MWSKQFPKFRWLRRTKVYFFLLLFVHFWPTEALYSTLSSKMQIPSGRVKQGKAVKCYDRI
jgi:hypothetical protein